MDQANMDLIYVLILMLVCVVFLIQFKLLDYFNMKMMLSLIVFCSCCDYSHLLIVRWTIDLADRFST